MEKKTTRKCCRCKTKAVDEYSGVEVDNADDNKVSSKLEQQMTAELNNNPRDND